MQVKKEERVNIREGHKEIQCDDREGCKGGSWKGGLSRMEAAGREGHLKGMQLEGKAIQWEAARLSPPGPAPSPAPTFPPSHLLPPSQNPAQAILVTTQNCTT